MSFLTDKRIINSLLTVLPFQIKEGTEQIVTTDSTHITVSIQLFGDVNHTLVVKAENKTFGELGKALYGMELDDAMLESFAGEFWNMVLGGIVMSAGTEGVQIDISTPTMESISMENAKVYHLDIVSDVKIGSLSVFVTEKEA